MTHKKIAALANVSISTVSKALSGSKDISSELAEKIQRIAIETGYFKEKNKRKLYSAKDKAPVIAVFCPEIISIHYSETVSSIKNKVEELGGYPAVYIYDFDDDKLQDIAQRLILKNAADGIIVLSSTPLKIQSNIPVVYCGSPIKNAGFDIIYSDNQGILNDAVSHLKKLGHKNIGFVGESLTLSRYKAFEQALKKYELPLNPEFVYINKERFEERGFAAVKSMLLQKELPTALIAAYDEIALAIIHELSKNGIRVPDDISVVGINDIPSAAYAQVPLTTVKTFSEEKYNILIDTLFEKIYTESTAIKQFLIPHELIVRESTAPPRA